VEPAVAGEEAGTSATCALLAGVVLGLIVGLGGIASQPAYAADAAAPEKPLPRYCILKEGCTGELMERWAKAKIAEVDTAFGPNFDPYKAQGATGFDARFQKPTTGAGRYKQFKIDFASPHPGIPSADDGRYPNTNQLEVEKFEAPYYKAVKERAEKAGILGKGGKRYERAPYKWEKTPFEMR